MKVLTLILAFGAMIASTQAQSAAEKKLYKSILPSVNLVDAPLSDALDYVASRYQSLNPTGGVNFVILDQSLREVPITVNLNHVRFADAVHYLVSLAGGKASYGQYAVSIDKAQAGKHPQPPKGNTTYINEKVNQIIIPNVSFEQTPVIDALEFLVLKSRELDPTNNRGINIVFARDRTAEALTTVSLKLSNIPFEAALQYVTQQAGYRVRLEPAAVFIY